MVYIVYNIGYTPYSIMYSRGDSGFGGFLRVTQLAGDLTHPKDFIVQEEK